MTTLGNFFTEEIVLENERARLTPLRDKDDFVLAEIAYEPQIWEWGMSNLKEQADLRAYIDTALTERQNKVSYPFLVFDKKMNCVAGSTRFGSISVPNKRVEIGWTWMHPRHQGSGLNKACKFLLLSFAFETLMVNRVELKTDVLNQQSRKAIAKIGAREEGIFRKHQVTFTGRERDSIFFSIIRDEWPEIKNTVFREYI
jgi:Acetyltransferases, including N-acetylases of ribosomal proteins